MEVLAGAGERDAHPVTDALTEGLGVSPYLSTAAFALVLALVFLAWFRSEGTLSIRAVTAGNPGAAGWRRLGRRQAADQGPGSAMGRSRSGPEAPLGGRLAYSRWRARPRAGCAARRAPDAAECKRRLDQLLATFDAMGAAN